MNPARPRPGAFITRLDALGDPEARVFDFRAGEALFSLIVTQVGGEVHAYENNCPHAHMPLDRPDGRVTINAGFLVCAMHGASFRITDGACASGPANAPLTRFAIEVRGGVVFAATAAAAAPPA